MTFICWTVTSGFIALSAHVEADKTGDEHAMLLDIRKLLFERFGIDHATIQVETEALHHELETCCGVDSDGVTTAHAASHER